MSDPKPRMLKPDERKPSEWALIRGCRLYNYALIDEVNGHMQARNWENAIALATPSAPQVTRATRARKKETPMFEVKNRWNGTVVYKSESATTAVEAVLEAVRAGAPLNDADLSYLVFPVGASLVGASLVGARLDGARLDGARLDRASLDRASLVGARLDGASLDGARLVGASLDGASLDGASLDGARLDGASLDGASLDGASLDRARLDGARLDRASLVGASLDGARLVGARLVGASLDGASLVGASLDGARLDGARLVGASLDGARLDRARLDGASLDGARLVGASLDGARLDGASLVGARLVGASLDGARLDRARLDGASLDGARLVGARLDPIRDDFWSVLSMAPAEVRGLLAALRKGKINGSTYTGTCACLVGTIANVRGVAHDRLGALQPNPNRAAEVWFLAIREGHKPENHEVARITEQWTLEWLAKNDTSWEAFADLDRAAGKALEHLLLRRHEMMAAGDAEGLKALRGELERRAEAQPA